MSGGAASKTARASATEAAAVTLAPHPERRREQVARVGLVGQDEHPQPVDALRAVELPGGPPRVGWHSRRAASDVCIAARGRPSRRAQSGSDTRGSRATASVRWGLRSRATSPISVVPTCTRV